MAFLDSSADASSEAEAGPPPGGGGPPGNPMAGGGPLLASIAGRQQGPQVSAPGPGDVGQAISLITQAYQFLKMAIPSLPRGSPVEADVMRTMQRLGKHLPQGAPGAGIQQTQLQDMLRNVLKNALLARIMGQMKQGGGQGGGPQQAREKVQSGPPQGALAQAPMPSTPLPGA